MAKKLENEDKLEHAWYIAFDSMRYSVIGREDDNEILLNEANNRLQQIDRKELFAEPLIVIRKRSHIDVHQLAVVAAEHFIDKTVGTIPLKVYLGGDR